MAKDKQADPAVSPAELNTCPPQATNYRATLAERFNTRFGGGRSPSPPTLLLGSTLPLARPTVARPTLWLPTAMNNGAAENR